MRKEELKNYMQYSVYEYAKEEINIIAVCDTYEKAKFLACLLALNDKSLDPYYITSINDKYDFVIGGGWYHKFQATKDGKIKMVALE